MYDLRGLAGDACPECGESLDRAKLAKSAIPWVHREGPILRALLQTAWLATFKTQLFCLEVARPVSLRDARKFRQHVAGLLAFVVMLFAALLMLFVEDLRDPMVDLWQKWPVVMSLLTVLSVILVMLFMLVFTGVHTYWFHPKGLPMQQQNRAVAISHYACAPLLGLIPAAIGIGLAIFLSESVYWLDEDALAWLAVLFGIPSGLLVILSLAAYLFVCTHMARFAAQRSGPAQVTMWLGLPVLWLGLGAVIFFVLPVAGLYAYLMVSTL